MLPSPGIKYLKQIQILTWRLSKGKLLTRETRNNRFIFPPQIIVFCDCRSKYRVSIAQWSSPFLYVLCWFIFRSAVNMTRARHRKLWPSSVRKSGRASVHPGTWTTSRTNSKTVSSSASTYIVHVPRDVSIKRSKDKNSFTAWFDLWIVNIRGDYFFYGSPWYSWTTNEHHR